MPRDRYFTDMGDDVLVFWIDSAQAMALTLVRGEDRPRFVHRCGPPLHTDDTDGGFWKVVGPNLSAGHDVHGWPDEGIAGRPTVTPSILCPGCGLHGYLTDGKWVPVA